MKCKYCGKEFERADGRQKFCCKDCYRAYYNEYRRKKAEELKKEVQTNKKSYGMSITAERMELINAMSGDEYRVKIDDLYDADGKAVGTKVSLYMKIKD